MEDKQNFMEEKQNFTIEKENVGCRLDLFLSEKLNDLTRSKIKNLIDNSKVFVSGKKVKSGYSLKEGDLVEGDSGYSAVFFFKRFTVPDKHQFYFEIFEKNGGRHLKFTASNKEILNAKKITK